MTISWWDNFGWNRWKMSTCQFMHFAWRNPIYFHAPSTLSRFRATIVWQVWNVVLPPEKIYLAPKLIRFWLTKSIFKEFTACVSWIPSLVYEPTKLWRIQISLTLSMHTCEWKIQALINVTLEFGGKNTWIFNPITKLNKSIQLAHPCHHFTPSNTVLIIPMSEGGLISACEKLVTMVLNSFMLWN